MAQEPSLKARAVALLSRREHTRLELRRKLLAYTDDVAAVEAVLDALHAGNWQSDGRYARLYAQQKAGRFGARRILHDLKAKGVGDAELAGVQSELAASELARAYEVWQRKFGHPAADARDYARQYRFMATRGFSADSIRQVLGQRYGEA